MRLNDTNYAARPNDKEIGRREVCSGQERSKASAAVAVLVPWAGRLRIAGVTFRASVLPIRGFLGCETRGPSRKNNGCIICDRDLKGSNIPARRLLLKSLKAPDQGAASLEIQSFSDLSWLPTLF